MSADTATNVAPSFFFNSAASQWAVTHMLGIVTRDQLHLALHILGLVDSSKSEHRTLSLRRIAEDLGYSRQTVKPIKAKLVSYGFLIQISTAGRSSIYKLGPAVDSDHYRFLVEQHKQLAANGQLVWPFNGAQRRGAATINPIHQQGVDQSERSRGGSVRAIQGVDQSERSTLDQSERSTIDSIGQAPMDKFMESQTQQPSAEVIPQAFGPADLSEQPEEMEGPCRPETSNGVERVGEQPTASHCAQGSALFAQSTNDSVDDEINSDESEWAVLTVDEIDNVEPDSPGCFPSSNSLHCMVEHMDGRLGYFSVVSTDEVWIQRVEVAKTGRIVETGETSCLYRQQENGWNGWSLLLSNGETITFAQLRELDRAEQLNTVAS